MIGAFIFVCKCLNDKIIQDSTSTTGNVSLTEYCKGIDVRLISKNQIQGFYFPFFWGATDIITPSEIKKVISSTLGWGSVWETSTDD